MATYNLYGFYTASKVGKTGLTVTIDIYNSSGSVVTGASATEIGGGLYKYYYTNASDDDYIAVFKTSDATVDFQHVPSLAVKQVSAYMDTTISSRLSSASYTAPDNASVTAIKAKTDNLPANPASQTNLDVAVSTRLASASYTTPPTSASIAGAVWDEILTGATHNINTSAGKRLRQLASNIIYMGTVVSATTNTITLDAGADSHNGAYDPSAIDIVSGTGTGQSRMVLQYDGASRTCTVDRDWKILPVAGDEFMITVNTGREHVNEGLAQGGTINTITLNANASPFDNTYTGQVVFIRSGTGADQACRVIAYDGTTKVATLAKNWHTIPDTTSAYVMLPTSILDLQTYANLISTTVWNNATRTLTSFGTLVQNVWSYATRTLTSSGGALTAAEVWSYVKRTLTPTGVVDSSVTHKIDAIRGDTLEYYFTNIDLTDYTSAYFTVKSQYKDTDLQSIVQVSSASGLIYLNGASASAIATSASLVLDAPNEKVQLVIDAEVTKQIEYNSNNYYYDLQLISASGVIYTPEIGTFVVIRDVTKTIT